MRRVTLLFIVSVVATAVLALFTLFTPTAQADQVGGVIDTDTTWTLAGSPYIITETIIIQPGVTLTVEAGVEVQAQPNRGITVNGLLLALGTAVQPITFTSTTESGFNDWHGLDVTSSGTVSLTHTTIRRAYASLEISGITANPVQLSHSHIHHNLVAMGSDVNAIHRLAMHNVTFSDNQFNYVWMGGVSGVLSDDVTLTDQPGLEGYVVGSSPFVTVPEGITLTMEAGTTFQFDYLFVHGHLETQGSVTATTVITGFSVTQIEETGSANINHTLMANGIGDGYVGLGILGNSSQPIHIQNSTIAQMVHPLVATADALHRLHMENVTFANNLSNRVFINGYSSGELAGNVSLTPQPGLEGYEYEFDNNNYSLTVPDGIMLTVEAGTTLMMPENSSLFVRGHLDAQGTITQPITFTSAANSGPGGWDFLTIATSGTAVLKHVTVQHTSYGVRIYNNPANGITIENSILQDNLAYPLDIDLVSLPGLRMTNTTFINNGVNRIAISEVGQQASLTANTRLTGQPGLEGYEVVGINFGALTVPQNITLTLEPGSVFMMPQYSRLYVDGHLQANGETGDLVTFTSATNAGEGEWGGVYVRNSGTVHLDRAIIRYSDTGLFVEGNTYNPVVLSDTQIDTNIYAIGANPNSLHRLQMNDVTFADNVFDRFFIVLINPENPLIDNVTLTTHPGLEGYELDTTGISFLVIPAGLEMNLEPGVQIMGQQNASILVEGTLRANGLADQPVIMTSAANNGPGGWWGVSADNGADISLVHTEIRYGHYGISTGYASASSTITMTNSRILSSTVGVSMYSGTIDIFCSTIAQNDDSGIFIENSGVPDVTISASEFGGNGAGIINNNSLPVDARHNFWGHPSGPGGVGPGSGDAVYGNVLYDPWLAEPTCSPPPPPVLPTISISDSTAVESAPFLTFTVTLNITGEQDVLVDYETVDGTAVANVDFLPISGTLTIPAGQVTAVLPVPLLDNDLDDGDRHFSLILSNPVNGELGNDTAIGLILDDDDPPIEPPITPTISISDSTAVETAPFLTFTVTLNITGEQDVLVDYETVDGTAVAHTDYLPISGTLTIPAGQVTAVLTVTLLNNDLDDGDRSFSLVLSNPVNGELGNDTAVGLILDDDDPPIEPPITPTISISDSTAVESAPFLTFTVTLNITSEQDVLVDYETVDGTAVAHTDYLPISGTLTIPAGQVTAVLTVTLLKNDLDDGDRTFTLVLSNPVNGELGNDTAVGTILDDDDPPPTPGWQIFLPVIIKP